MKLPSYFAILLFLISFNTEINFAQPFQLAPLVSNSFGGSDKEEFFGGCALRGGGYLLSGLSYSKDGDIDPTSAYDSADAFIVKVDDTGTLLWSRSVGGDSYDKARFGIEDTDSNLVVTGGTLSVNGDITSSYGESDLFVIKLDKNGNTIWFRNYGGTDLESGRFVSQNAEGNYMIAGYSTSEDFDVPTHRGWHDGWIMKLDTAGNIIWSQTYGGSKDDRIRCLSPLSDGGYMFAGSSKSNNQQNLGNHGLYDFWVGRIDSSGNLLWSKQFGGTQDDIALQVSPGPGGNFLVTGYTSSNDGDVTGYYGNTDGWVICVDTSGSLVWQKCLGGSGADRLYRSYCTVTGRIYSGGYSDSDDFDLANANSGYFAQYWLLSLDQTQTLEWSYLTGGSFGDYGNEMLVNEQDSTFTMMGDSRSTNMAVIGNHGEFDFWLVKIGWINTSGLPSSAAGTGMYFNMQESLLHFQSQAGEKVEITVADITGRILVKRQAVISEGENQISIEELKSAAKGLYTVTVTGETYSRTLKIASAGY